MSDQRQRRDPVVTGIGAITPVGMTAPETWQALLEGRSGITAIESFDASDLPVQIAGEIHGFDGEAVMGPKRFRRSARFSQLAVAAAREAVADAGLDTAAERRSDRRRGQRRRGRRARDRAQRPRADRARPARPQPVLRPLDDPQHGRLRGGHRPRRARPGQRQRAGLRQRHRRPARGAAPDRGGEADVVIAGGTDAGISRSMFAGLALMGPLSERNDAPEEASRPFDADRDGFVFGEGAVVLVVESAEHAAGPRCHRLRHGRRRGADLRRLPHLRPRAVGRPRRAGPSSWRCATRASPPRSSTTSAPTAPPPRPTTPRRRAPSGWPSASGLRRAGQLAQVDGGPPHRGRGRPVGDDLPAGDPRRGPAPHHQPPHPRPRVRPGLRAR